MKVKSVSIRMPNYLHEKLNGVAKAKGLKLATYIRETMESQTLNTKRDSNDSTMNAERNPNDSKANDLEWFKSQLESQLSQAATERQRFQDLLLAKESNIKSLTELAEAQRVQVEERSRPLWKRLLRFT